MAAKARAVSEKKEDTADLIPENSVVINCADSMDVRRLLFQTEYLKNDQPVFLDGRMSAESFQGYLCSDECKESVTHYRGSLFPQREMYREACTAKSTIYCAAIAAGFLCSLYKQWAMRSQTGYFHWHISFDLRTYDLIRTESSI